MRPVSGLEEGVHPLLQDIAHRAGAGVGDAQNGLLVVAGTRYEGHLGGVVAPFQVREGASAGDMVAHGRAVLVRRHVEAHQARVGGRVEIQHDAVDAEDDRVLGERIAPGVQLRMAHLGVHHVHHAHAARIVLEGGDPAAVGGPAQHGSGASHPARVVGGVAEVLLAVEGQLRLLPGPRLAHPEVVVADERLLRLVGRDDAGGAAKGRLEAHGYRHVVGAALFRAALQLLAAVADRAAAEGAAVFPEIISLGREENHRRAGNELPPRQARRRRGRARHARQRVRHPLVVEGRLAAACTGVDHQVLAALRGLVPVPEAAVRHPLGIDRAVEHQRVHVLPQMAFRAGVVLRGERARRLLRVAGGRNRSKKERSQNQEQTRHPELCRMHCWRPHGLPPMRGNGLLGEDGLTASAGATRNQTIDHHERSSARRPHSKPLLTRLHAGHAPRRAATGTRPRARTLGNAQRPGGQPAIRESRDRRDPENLRAGAPCHPSPGASPRCRRWPGALQNRLLPRDAGLRGEGINW